MIYIFIGSFFIYLSFVEIFLRKVQNSKFSFFVALVFLLLLSGLRYEVGMDWPAYVGFYQDVGYTYEHVEIGYSLINDLFSTLDINYNIFLFMISFITLFFIYQAGINLKYKLIFIFIYFSDLFLYFNLSGMRQGIAIAITLFSVKYIIEQKKIYFFIVIVLATLFHVTALIFLIAYYIYSYKSTIKKNLLIIFFLFFLTFSLESLIELIISFVDNYKIVYYLTLSGVQNDNFQAYIIGIIKRSVVVIFYLSIPLQIRQKSNLKNLMNIYIFGFIIYVIFYTINEDIGVRLGAYFLILEALIVSIFFQQKIHAYHKLLIFIVYSIEYVYKLIQYANLPEYSYKVFL